MAAKLRNKKYYDKQVNAQAVKVMTPFSFSRVEKFINMKVNMKAFIKFLKLTEAGT